MDGWMDKLMDEVMDVHTPGGAGISCPVLLFFVFFFMCGVTVCATDAVRLRDSTPTSRQVCITGAAGQICYSLIFMVANGDAFGADQPVHLRLLDIAPMMDKLSGVVMELNDCAFPLVAGVVATADAEEAFDQCDAAMLVGSMPRREGMDRKDLLEKNAGIFKAQGQALAAKAKASVKVVVVGNPANTNCAVLAASAGDALPATAFSALTRLDQNRAYAQLAAKAGCAVSEVDNVIIWGNHSKTQVWMRVCAVRAVFDVRV